jgi:DNA-binding Xre family transcriptional regulator
MFDMVRLRMAELLAAKNIKPTAYALAKASKGAINQTTAGRLIAGPRRVDLTTLDVLCTVFDVTPPELWERDRTPPAPPSGKPARPKGKSRRSPSSP